MVDFITKLLLVARKDTILVVCNRLFKMIYFVATTEGTLVKELVYVLYTKSTHCQIQFILGVKVCEIGLEICRLVEQP